MRSDRPVEGCAGSSKRGQRRQRIRKYKTFYQVLRQMVAWLVEQGVTHVAMEATGVYWKPVFHALCEAEQVEVLLVNARHAKNVPGRKTDVKDSEWLAQLLECGLLHADAAPGVWQVWVYMEKGGSAVQAGGITSARKRRSMARSRITTPSGSV